MIVKPRPSLWTIFSTWFLTGIQSFGGGSATFYLIHQTCISRGWLDEDEFIRAWSLAQISPGINLLKLTILIGYHLRGWPGLLAGAVGLLVPSAVLTMLMTAGFAAIRGQPLVQAALRGVMPATIGLSLAMGVQMAQPLLVRARREGRARLGVHILIGTGAGLLLVFTSISPVLALLLAGVAGTLLLAVIPMQPAPAADKDSSWTR